MSIERRTIDAGGFEVRASSTEVILEGHASTFDQPYDMGMYSESVAQGAFRKTLQEKPDVRFLVNHDGLPLARTTSGTMELAEDSSGLYVRATLDPSDPDVARIIPKMQRGDLTQMSFAFRTIKDSWDEAYTKRTMKELSLRDGDVSLVTYPANPNATAKLRAQRSVIAAAPLMSRIVEEIRAGKQLSAATFDVLAKILDAMAAADMELDQALIDLSDLMGVPNPDEDEAVDDGDGTDAENPAEDAVEEAPARSLPRLTAARAVALALHSHR